MQDYNKFLEDKLQFGDTTGFDIDISRLNSKLYDFQSAIVRWSLQLGRSAIFADCGLGKGQPPNSKVLTNCGWVKIKDLKIDDMVIASDGNGYPVMGIYPKSVQPTYRIHFSDRTSLVVDLDHLHICRTNNDRQRGKKWRIMNTLELLECKNLRYGKDNKSRNYDIPVVGPIKFKKQYLPKELISPYIMGILLGDGHLKGNITISTSDAAVVERVKKELPEDIKLSKVKSRKYDYRIITGLTGTKKHPFRELLNAYGLLNKLAHEKIIPMQYLFASDYKDRLALLQGLMDSDGYVDPCGCSQFYSTSRELAEGVLFLIYSLGGIPTHSRKRTSLNGNEMRPCHIITFSLARLNPFYVPRKAKKWNENPRDNGRWIDRIEYEKEQETICISVGSPDQSYVTENFIVTHNTPIQLDWANQVHKKTNKKILILAPLAVSQQTVREGEKFGIEVTACRNQSQVKNGINITNYEMMHKFDPSEFVGIVLDESGILKSFSGKYRNAIISSFKNTKYKLACTATPAPNDYMELGNHSEFLNILTRPEMLATFFVHDGGQTSQWRLKGHAQYKFWEWLCSYAVMLRKPSDLGFDDDGFILPSLEIKEHLIESTQSLFVNEAKTLQERQAARRNTVAARSKRCAELVGDSTDAWLIWCNLNYESSELARQIDGAVEVKGSDSAEYKEEMMLAFSSGEIKRLITKPSIAGFGMNWQHCHNMAFVGLSDSYEQFYQALRRCWRFMQLFPVTAHVITAEEEGAVVANIKRKERDAMNMADQMVINMSDISKVKIRGKQMQKTEYKIKKKSGTNWKMYLGDCVDISKRLKDESIDYSIFSPPFASLYTYTDSERDMGNCKDYKDFAVHFKYLTKELYRITKPGRNLSFHCMQLPIAKEREGYIGIRDFRGILIRLFQRAGFIFHSEVTIWKDPVVAMQRTKAIGLLWKQLKKDSTLSRQGIADYLITMRKPGVNNNPVDHTPQNFPVKLWQKWASPVWTDIKPGDTLSAKFARSEKDERHICPLQLEVIRRGIILWSNPNDIVFSPFAGIGSEGYIALKENRKFIGIELKESYYKQAIEHLSHTQQKMEHSFV